LLSDTFFNYAKYRWLTASVLFLVVATLIYLWDSPVGGANGGTFYGYTLGIISTAAIVFLMWYGIRKRSYHSYRTTLKGWLSAHVWIGVSLLALVPLHAGMRMGWNVHSLAYILMTIVIVSGIWGAINYKTLAPQIESHRGSNNLKTFIEQMHIDAEKISALCRGKSDELLSLRNKLEVILPAKLHHLLFRRHPMNLPESEVVQALGRLPESERADGLTLVGLCEKKRNLCLTIQREIRTAAKLKLWLLVHLPISFALVAAVLIHIFSVLFYR